MYFNINYVLRMALLWLLQCGCGQVLFHIYSFVRSPICPGSAIPQVHFPPTPLAKIMPIWIPKPPEGKYVFCEIYKIPKHFHLKKCPYFRGREIPNQKDVYIFSKKKQRMFTYIAWFFTHNVNSTHYRLHNKILHFAIACQTLTSSDPNPDPQSVRLSQNNFPACSHVWI